jgi:ADP-ribose pyrophosphatase YjhB (NUDIX family)
MKEMTAALIIEDKKILLVHNTKYNQERIEPPGGKRENKESLIECVKRESEEELGIVIDPTDPPLIYETDSPEGKFIVHMYFAKIISGTPRIKEKSKHSVCDWYSFEDMLRFKEEGKLVPNLCSALDELKKYL